MLRLLTSLLFLAAGASLFAGNFEIDSTHSFITFRVQHNTVGEAFGRFNKFAGSINYEGDKAQSVNVTIDANSIDTGNDQRDGHLRKADFFNAVEFPDVKFTSTKVESQGDKLTVTGNLTVVGQTKPITVQLTQKGPVDGRNGSKVRGLHGSFTFKRSQYGISYGMGGIGDDVTVTISLEVVSK